MCLRVVLQSSLRIALVLLIGIALLQVPFVSIFVSARGKGWRGIVPLQSKRADVERLFGPGINGHYQFDEERAHVNYAEGECNPVNGCLCLVPKDTVISIYVQLEVELKFSKLNINKRKYEKLVSRKDPSFATYSNVKEGIIYTVNEENDDVTAIEYLPTAKDCQDLLRHAKRSRLKKLRSQNRLYFELQNSVPNIDDLGSRITRRLTIGSR